MAAVGAMILASNPRCGMTVKPFAGSSYKMPAAYELKQGQCRHFHRLPSGLNMEVVSQKARRGSEEKEKPPLVFVHGSFHAAWCWAEHWLPFFSRHGFDCYALSLLAQGESDSPDGAVAGSLQSHAADVADFIHKEIQFPPVLLGHSFGGLIVQYYIANVGNEKLQVSEMESAHPYLAGAVLVCSVPPSGNSGLVWRYLFSKPIAAFKVTRSLAAKAFQTSLPLCRETFFSAAMEDRLVLRLVMETSIRIASQFSQPLTFPHFHCLKSNDPFVLFLSFSLMRINLTSYQKLMTESSRKPLFDLRKLNASLPVPPMKDPSTKILVLGASDDFIVDAEGLSETGRFYGVSPVCVEGVAHDMMLDCSWEKGAQAILSWLHALDRDQLQ